MQPTYLGSGQGQIESLSTRDTLRPKIYAPCIVDYDAIYCNLTQEKGAFFRSINEITCPVVWDRLSGLTP